MWQIILALVLVLWFVVRLLWQWHRGRLTAGQFIFWLCFWLAAGAAIIFIKTLDKMAVALGFSASGIQILLYVSVILIFNWLFKLRLRLEKLDTELTKLAGEMARRNPKFPSKKDYDPTA